MKILIIYYLRPRHKRKTTDHHLYSFSRYSDASCFYVNIVYGTPAFLRHINFDLVLYHYSFLGLKYYGEEWFESLLQKNPVLKDLKGYRAAMPQDDYVNSAVLCKFFREYEIRTVFTCVSKSEWEFVYPRAESGLQHYVTVLTGYIDENLLPLIAARRKEHKFRPIDVGYRARKMPYWLGKHGLIKWQITEQFRLAAAHSNLNFDISNDLKDVFADESWYEFLGKCRVVLGCEGGASLLDRDGEIAKKVDAYVKEFPSASYQEVEQTCFPGKDGNLNLFVISPRHFEASITGTCQALVEGEYSGILNAGEHYIEIKKDWSNLPDVVKAIQDREYCAQIAANAFRDIVESGKYTYRSFVNLVLEHVNAVHSMMAAAKQPEPYLVRLKMREKYPFLFSPVRCAKDYVFHYFYLFLLKMGWYESFSGFFRRLPLHSIR